MLTSDACYVSVNSGTVTLPTLVTVTSATYIACMQTTSTATATTGAATAGAATAFDVRRPDEVWYSYYWARNYTVVATWPNAIAVRFDGDAGTAVHSTPLSRRDRRVS